MGKGSEFKLCIYMLIEVLVRNQEIFIVWMEVFLIFIYYVDNYV